MANSFTVSLLLSVLYIASASSQSAAPAGSPTGTPISAQEFIKVSCNVTRDPTICVDSLSPYASSIQDSPRRLIFTAVNVSLANVQSTMTLVDDLKKMKGLTFIESGLLSSCYEMFVLSQKELATSKAQLDDMYKSKGPDFKQHFEEAKTSIGWSENNFFMCNYEFDQRKEVVKLRALVIPMLMFHTFCPTHWTWLPSLLMLLVEY
ncbi:hypothetical protein Tsubulata_022711 [Turnera subulata]|uniref:Pectinesterase inhibitor domain-containing protein n=1 Tax=Turnera subulata TaxID=218843 RepID=A0A9Q0EYU2_9ROSI|nr:hypothetical protein Tsubulata_022711 [Turnera subulata]